MYNISLLLFHHLFTHILSFLFIATVFGFPFSLLFTACYNLKIRNRYFNFEKKRSFNAYNNKPYEIDILIITLITERELKI